MGDYPRLPLRSVARRQESRSMGSRRGGRTQLRWALGFLLQQEARFGLWSARVRERPHGGEYAPRPPPLRLSQGWPVVGSASRCRSERGCSVLGLRPFGEVSPHRSSRRDLIDLAL